MYICSCRAVTDRQICGAIADGACTLAEVARQCDGAGITCGGCQPLLRELLTERGHPCPRAESLRKLRDALGDAVPLGILELPDPVAS
jgi:bacterioferritin-associated ferredoxin